MEHMLARPSIVRLLFLLVFTAAGFSVRAQLTIAKNDATCLYGLKDAAGKWGVPAAYTSIETLPNKHFKANDGTFTGVLTPEGKLLIPLKYEEIRFTGESYVVRHLGKESVLRRDGSELFPAKYSEIYFESGQRARFREQELEMETWEMVSAKSRYYLYETVNDTIRTTITDTSGNVLLDHITGYLAPFGTRAISTVGLHKSYKGVRGHARLLRLNGKPAQPDIYSEIEICGSRFIVSKGTRIGYIDLHNKVLFPPLYEVAFLQPYRSEKPCPSGGGLFLLRDSLGKVGLMDGHFNIVVPTVFDELQELSPNPQSDDAAFLVKKDGKYGILSPAGTVSVQPVYDTIIVRLMSRYDSKPLKHALLFCYTGEKLHILDDNGTPWLAGTFDEFKMLSSGFNYVLRDRECLTIVSGSPDTIAIHYPALFTQSDSLLIYRWKEDQLVLAVSGNGFSLSDQKVKKIGDMYAIAPKQRHAGKFVLLNASGRPIEGVEVQSLGQRVGNYIEIYNPAGGALLDLRNGRTPLPAYYNRLETKCVAQNIVWVRERGSDFWMALDTTGARKSAALFDEVPEACGEGRGRAYSGGLAGLIDEKLEWLIQPNYLALYPMTETTAAIFTKERKFGIIGLDGKLIVDTVYTELTEVYRHFIADEQENAIPAGRIVWLFEAPGKQLLFDTQGPELRSEAPGDAGAKNIARQLVVFACKADSNAADAFDFFVPGQRSTEFSTSRFSTTAYNWFRERTHSRHCNFANRQIPDPEYGSACRRSRGTYQSVVDFGLFFCSLQQTEDRTTYSMEMPIPGSETTRANFVWRNGRAEYVSLTSIFGNGKWLDRLLEAEFRRQNPEACLTGEIVRKDFQLSREGVHVSSDRGTVLISTAELAKHAESRWIVPLLK